MSEFIIEFKGKILAEVNSEDEARKMTGQEKRTKMTVEPWLVERAREILKAQGRLFDFKIEDMDQDELREKVENAARSRRMREEGFSITHERNGQASGSGSRLIWDEVMK